MLNKILCQPKQVQLQSYNFRYPMLEESLTEYLDSVPIVLFVLLKENLMRKLRLKYSRFSIISGTANDKGNAIMWNSSMRISSLYQASFIWPLIIWILRYYCLTFGIVSAENENWISGPGCCITINPENI